MAIFISATAIGGIFIIGELDLKFASMRFMRNRYFEASTGLLISIPDFMAAWF